MSFELKENLMAETLDKTGKQRVLLTLQCPYQIPGLNPINQVSVWIRFQ